MADAYQLEQSVDRYLLEDGTGVYILEQQPAPPPKVHQAIYRGRETA